MVKKSPLNEYQNIQFRKIEETATFIFLERYYKFYGGIIRWGIDVWWLFHLMMREEDRRGTGVFERWQLCAASFIPRLICYPKLLNEDGVEVLGSLMKADVESLKQF